MVLSTGLGLGAQLEGGVGAMLTACTPLCGETGYTRPPCCYPAMPTSRPLLGEGKGRVANRRHTPPEVTGKCRVSLQHSPMRGLYAPTVQSKDPGPCGSRCLSHLQAVHSSTLGLAGGGTDGSAEASPVPAASLHPHGDLTAF